ncbi:MAG: diguanylate cyclase, partial [Clostridia bacterium]|nr:diguanylate cyclase [Clostridia bacterium]
IYGNSTGDTLLATYAEKLKAFCEDSVFLGRIGGNEYAFIIQGNLTEVNILNYIDKIKNIISEPVKIGNDVISTTASYGIASYPNNALSSSDMLKCVNSAVSYAKANGKERVSIITKANIIKTTDGKFLNICKKIGEEYPEIITDEWYIDITTAKLIDPKRRKDFKVFVLPNLYGDIITDEAAEFQGGVGTAGSANIGKRYAMFEAIHGSAPRMIKEGRGAYADPCSMLRAAVMLLSHIGYVEKANALEAALDKCMITEKKLVITGRDDGCTCSEFGDYLMETVEAMN